jgi:iron(III) transport system substrate-binding protein
MRSGLSRRVVLLVALVATTAACLVGSSVASSQSNATLPPNPIKSTLAKVKGLKLQAREAKLEQLAEGEGQVNVYTSLSSTVVKPLQAAWDSTFPKVKLNLYRASSEDVSNRFLSESSAGTHGADIVETNGTTMLIYQHKKKLLVPYQQSPYAKQIPKEYRFDTFTADRREKFVVAWNTNLVKDPPKSFEDLTDPKWKGKLAMEPTDADWYAGISAYFTQQAKPKMTQAQVDAMFKKIAANSQLIGGHTNEINALAAGQVQVVVTGHAQATEQLMAKHAPIAFTPFVKPVVERPQGVGISYLASHPAAALLFYDWILSGKGQKVLQDNGVEPANPYFPDASFASNPTTTIMNIRPIVAHWEQDNKHYASVIGG